MVAEKNTKNRPRKIALWFLVSVFILLAGIYALRNVLIAPYAIAFLERTVAANLGLQISIGHLEGSYFSNLEIKNVTTDKGLADGPLTDVQLHRLKLTYRLWDLLDGLPAFLAASAIELDGARLSIQLTGETQAGEATKSGTGFPLPPGLPQIRIHDSFIRVNGFGYETFFEGITLTSGFEQSGPSRLRLQVDQWSLKHPGLRDIAVALQADMAYSSESLKIENFLADQQLLIKSAVIGLSGLPGDVHFDMRLNPAGGHLNADGRVAANRLQVALSGSDIDLSRISGLLAPPSVPFGGRLSVQGKLDLPFSDLREMVGDLAIQLANGSVYETTVEQLAFKVTAGDTLLEVADLKLITGANRLSINRASLAAGVLYGSDFDAILRSLTVDWRLEASDVPAALRLFGLTVAGDDDRIPAHNLMLTGRMEGGDLIIPEGRLDAAGGHIGLKTARIALPVGERAIIDSTLTGDLALDLPDLAILSRIFALPALGGAVQGQIKVSGTLQAPQGAAVISGKKLTYRKRVLGNLAIRAKGGAGGIVVESASLERGRDRASGQGTINLAEKSFEAVNVGLSVSDLGPYFSDLLPLFIRPTEKTVNVRGSLQAALQLAGPVAGPTGSLNLKTRQMRVEGTPLGDADIDLVFSPDRLKISSAVFKNRNDRLHLSGSIRYREKQLDGIKAQMEISDLGVYKAFWSPPATDVSGLLQVRLQATGDLSRPHAEAELRFENFRYQDIHLEKGRIQLKSAGRLVSIDAPELTMQGHQLQLAADIDRNLDDTEFEITLKKAAVIGQRTLLALDHAATCRLSRSGRIIFDKVTLAGSAGRVSVDGRFDLSGTSDLRIALSDLTGDGWFDLIFTDQFRFRGLNAQLKVGGQIDSPLVVAKGTLDNLGSPDVPIAFSGRFNVEYDNKGFKIHDFAWQGTEGQQIQLSGAIPIDPLQSGMFIGGPVALSGRARIDDVRALAFIIPWAERTGGSIHCDLNLSGTWKRPAGALQLAVKDLKRPADIRPLPPGPYTASGELRIDGDLVTLQTLEAYSAGWKLTVQGQWRGVPTLPDLIGSAAPRATGQIQLAGSLAVSDLSWVAREVDGVRRLTGSLEAQGRLQGPITAPAADAVIKLSGAEFAPDFDMPSLRSLNLEAAVTPQAVDVRSLTGELGGAPFELTGSWNLAGETGPAADLRLHGENLLLYRNENLRLRSDTDLTLKGPLDRLELAGEVAVTDGRFSKNFGVIEGFAAVGRSDNGGAAGFQLFSIRQPPLRSMVFNVRITAKEPFVVRNNLVRGTARPDLLLTGTGEVPLLVGKVYVESTRLYLPAGRLKLETGIVHFDQADPDRPRLDLIGTSTMLGYDITAVIDGPYDEPVITLSSIPPLPNDELLLLLLTGQPPKSSSAQSSANRQGLNIAMFLGRDLIGRWTGDDSDEGLESILDRFDVEVGRAITRQGEDTINSQFRVADNILTEGDSLYLTGERDVFDYYNGGVRFVFRFR